MHSRTDRSRPDGMILADLLAGLALSGYRLWCGDPAHVDITRVRAFGPEAVAWAAPGTFFLVARTELVDNVLQVANRQADVAFLLGDDDGDAHAHRFVGAKCPVLRVPAPIALDLAAHVQRLLDRADSPAMSGDAIARARQDLTEDLVLGRYQDVVALARRARGLGVPLDGVTTAMVVGFSDFERYFLQHEDEGELYFQRLKGGIVTLTRRLAGNDGAIASVTPHAEGALVLGHGPIEQLGRDIAATLREEMRFVPVAVAVGMPKTALVDVLKSYQEARMALALRTKLRLVGRFIAFREVTGYALLQRIVQAPEIASMLDEQMGALREAEARHHPVLIETLAAYYDNGGSLKRAAAELRIHPKTLRYRLDRAEAILGEGALDSDKRLLFHLAAKYVLWVRS